MEQAVLSTLAERTGRSLAEWVELVKKSGPAGEKSRISWLRTEHRLGKSTARWIVERATGNSLPYDPERLVSKLFGEPGELSRATYDALVLTLLGLGSDVTVTPCKTVVPVRRRQVFAELRPATRGRVELGLSLGRSTVSGRLSSTAGLARRSGISHRLLLSGPAEVSDELREILDAAYRSSPR